MSLYNLLFGENKASPMLLKMLGIEREKIPRYRDCMILDGKIVIHTRTGGGNREYYDSPNTENVDGPWNTTMYENPYFLYDADDDFDCTYANFYFKFPEDYKDDLEALNKIIDQYTPSEKWMLLIEALKQST